MAGIIIVKYKLASFSIIANYWKKAIILLLHSWQREIQICSHIMINNRINNLKLLNVFLIDLSHLILKYFIIL